MFVCMYVDTYFYSSISINKSILGHRVNKHLILCSVKIIIPKLCSLGPDCYGLVGWSLYLKAKGHWFNSRSGHIPGWGAFERQPIDISLPPLPSH